MQTQTDDLLDLIKSLSPTEKRYFTVEAQKTNEKGKKEEQEENASLILFNILNSLEEYDEDTVKAQLRRKLSKGPKTEKFIKRLATEKYNLYMAILKVMRNFNSKNSDYIKLKDYIIYAKHLLDKGLYFQSAKMLRKAKKLATEYSNQLALIEINWAERSLVWKLKEKNREDEVGKLFQEKQKAFDNLQTELSHQDNYDKLCLELVKHHKLTEIQTKEIKEKFHDFIFNNKRKKTAFAELRHIQMKGFFYILTNERENSFQTTTEEYQWWEKNPQFKKEDFFRYKISLNNYLLANNRRKKFDLVLGILKSLEEKKRKSSLDDLMIFDFTCLIKLLILINKIQFKEAKKLVPFIKKGLRNHFLSPPKKRVIYYNLGTLFFLSGDLQDSKEWLQKLLKGHNTGTREDIRFFGSLILVLCLFELNEDAELEKLFRSIQRVKRDNKQIGPNDLENTVLSHLKTIAYAPDYEKKDAIREFQSSLLAFRGEKNQDNALAFLEEFYIWTRSKLEKKTMEQVLREENEKDTD